MPSSKASKSETVKSVAKTVGRLYFLDLSAGRVLTSNPTARTENLSRGAKNSPTASWSTSQPAISTGQIWEIPRLTTARSIVRTLDGTNVTNIVPPGKTWTPKQLQLDAKNGKLYWSDREGMRVMPLESRRLKYRNARGNWAWRRRPA